jgi:hypothetical protein
MTNALFGFPRVTPNYTLSGGTWSATYPLTHLLVLPLSKVARSTATTLVSTVIDGTTATPQIAGMIGLVRHNLSLAATIKLTCWTTSARTVTSFVGAFESVWPAGWTMTATEQANAVWTWYKRFGAAGSPGLTVGAFRIEINDVTNPAGYVQAGFVEISQVFEARYNFAWGMQYGFNWRSQVAEALGGVEYVDRRQKQRVVRGTFPYTTRADAMTKHYEMQRQYDLNVPFLFVPMPDEVLHYPRTIMLCTQIDPGLMSMVARMGATGLTGLLDSVPFAFREVIG